MSAPRWARWLLVRLAPPERDEEVVGDLEEAHQDRARRRGRLVAAALTTLETLDVALVLVRQRLGRRGAGSAISWLDIKLALRMLVKYPGLTLLGGVSIAFAIFVGAATFELFSQVLAPTIPLPEGGRIVEIHLWDASRGDVERRVRFHASTWREPSHLDSVHPSSFGPPSDPVTPEPHDLPLSCAAPPGLHETIVSL